MTLGEQILNQHVNIFIKHNFSWEYKIWKNKGVLRTKSEK